MSAECQKCGSDLLGTQWDEGGMSCPVCDLRTENERLREALEAADWLLTDFVANTTCRPGCAHRSCREKQDVLAKVRAALERKEKS